MSCRGGIVAPQACSLPVRAGAHPGKVGPYEEEVVTCLVPFWSGQSDRSGRRTLPDRAAWKPRIRPGFLFLKKSKADSLRLEISPSLNALLPKK